MCYLNIFWGDMMKGKGIVKLFLFLLLFIFFCSYIVSSSGYYEYYLSSQKNLTDEEIKRFERDVKLGKDIDLKGYLENSDIDYSNEVTRKVSSVSIRLNKYLKSVIMNTFHTFDKLFY